MSAQISSVIPGRREAANSESILRSAAAYGFRARVLGVSETCISALKGASRNDEGMAP